MMMMNDDERLRHRIKTMSSDELEELGQEIALVFQRCSNNPESEEHHNGRETFNAEGMMDSIISAIFYMCFPRSEQKSI